MLWAEEKGMLHTVDPAKGRGLLIYGLGGS